MGLDLYHFKATLHPKDLEEPITFREDDFDDHALDVLGFRRFIQIIPDWDYPTRIVIVKDEEVVSAARSKGRSLTGDKADVVLLTGEPADLVQRVGEIEASRGWPRAERLIRMSSEWTSSRSGSGYSYAHGWENERRPLEEWTWGLPTVEVRRNAERDPPAPSSNWMVVWARKADSLREELERNPPVSPPVQRLEIFYPVPADYRGLYVDEVGYQRGLMSEGFYKEFRGVGYFRRADVLRASSFLRPLDDPEDDAKLRANFQEHFIENFEEGTSIFDVSW